MVLGELGDFPFLPELPNRGPGSEMIGRAGTLLVAMPIEIVPSGWRLTAHPGRDLRQARDFLSRDLDALEQAASTHQGVVKLQVCGPWTLAASLELPSGHRVVADHGAVRDLVASLAEGVAAHVADVAARLPAAQVVLQLDEPLLPAVLNATVPTASGYGTLRSVEPNIVTAALREVFASVSHGGRIVHSCADDVPIALLREGGADVLSIDLTTTKSWSAPRLDALGEAVEAGVRLMLGVVPSVGSSSSAPLRASDGADKIKQLWNVLGFGPGQLASTVVPTTSCGFAGASAQYVRQALRVSREIGEELLQSS